VKALLQAFHQDPEVKALPRCEYGVFRALCYLAGQSNGDCFPHHRTVAQISRYSARSARRAIRKLAKREYLDAQQEYLETPNGKRLILRNRYFFRKWARLENGIWSNGIQKWEDGVTAVPIKGDGVRQSAPEADPQGGGMAKMTGGVWPIWPEGYGQIDPLSKGNLNKGKSNPGEKDKNLSLSQKNGAGAPGERENEWGVDLEEEVTEKEGSSLSGTHLEPPGDNGEEEARCARVDTPEGKEGTSLRSEENKTKSVTSSSSEQGNGSCPEELPLQGKSGSLRVPSAARGARAASKVRPARVRPCTCEEKDEHPPGMPSLEEIGDYLRELRAGDENAEAWVTEHAETLHDDWLASGFRMKGGGPICDWRASLRGWERRRDK
jgi:hypothetical protein